MMTAKQTGLGVAPLVLAGGAAVAAGAGAWVWNQARGMWEMLHLPGAPMGVAVPPPTSPPPPSAAGAAGVTWDQRAQDAAQAAQWELWRRTAFDVYYSETGTAPAAPTARPSGDDEIPLWMWAAGAAVVLLVAVRR